MRAPRNSRIAAGLGAVVLTMAGLSFAAVPFYNWFCRVTGYAGTPTVAAAPAGAARDETIIVRFDANTGPGMPWEFRPQLRTMEVRLDEPTIAFFEAFNPTSEAVAGTASFNVAPDSAGPYFAKIACFCFELQVLGPGERVEMPVSFFVDPEILGDAEAKGTTVITLSYTMFRAALPETEVGALTPSGPADPTLEN